MERHPLEPFIYCPRCGKDKFSVHNARSKQCDACGFVYYANVASAVACIIKDADGRLLTVRRGREPAKGTLDLPGGFIDPEETAEEGVSREVFEETGLTTKEIKYLFSVPNLYPYAGMDVYTTDLIFLVECDNLSQAVANDDAAEIVILSHDNINPELFGLRSIKYAIKKLLSDNLV